MKVLVLQSEWVLMGRVGGRDCGSPTFHAQMTKRSAARAEKLSVHPNPRGILLAWPALIPHANYSMDHFYSTHPFKALLKSRKIQLG